MQIRTFIIPITDDGSAQAELNRFLHSHKVLSIEQQFYTAPSGASWCFCVTYISGSSETKFGYKGTKKVDYKNVLNGKEFERFSILRELRKEMAKEDAVPAYAVFTDAELAELAKKDILNENTVLTVEGIGEKRFEKYGKAIIEAFKAKIEAK
ncbi:MAG: helicase [Flavobacteriales bacterium]|nr:MAG: helicase [Flavobacteriales bacterium]